MTCSESSILPSPATTASEIAALWVMGNQADQRVCDLQADGPAPKRSPVAGKVQRLDDIADEARARADVMWSLVSILPATTPVDAFVLAIRAHDLSLVVQAGDASNPKEVAAELVRVINALTAYLADASGSSAETLGLGAFYSRTATDWATIRTAGTQLCTVPKHAEAK